MAVYRGLNVFLELAAGWETGRGRKMNKRIKKDRNHRQKSMLSKNEGLGFNSFFRKALNLPCRVKQHGLANSSKHMITIKSYIVLELKSGVLISSINSCLLTNYQIHENFS